MKNLFERTSSNWVRYSEYEWKTAENGMLPYAHKNGAAGNLRPAERISAAYPGCH